MTENISGGKLIEIDSLSQFVKKIGEFENKEILYRGQSGEWHVTSSAYRRLKQGGATPNSKELKELLEYNEKLIEKARRYPDSDEFREIHPINLLAKLQHNGAATSLIDFTKSALLALWFACQNDKKDGRVFCLDMSSPDEFLTLKLEDEKDLGKILTLQFRNGTEESENKSSQEKNTPPNQSYTSSALQDDKEIATWEPLATNNRILKQDSFFIFNKTGILESNRFAKIFVIKGDKKQP